jgi:hypothetical protein
MTETHFGKLTRKLLALAFLMACFAFVSTQSHTMARPLTLECCSDIEIECDACLNACLRNPNVCHTCKTICTSPCDSSC